MCDIKTTCAVSLFILFFELMPFPGVVKNVKVKDNKFYIVLNRIKIHFEI